MAQLLSAFALPLLGILQFLEDFDFIVKVVVFAYMVFWLYVNLRESQVLFGVASIVAAYFILLQAIPTIILVVIFVVFVAMGTHLQMLIQFGLFPLLRIFGIELEHPEIGEQRRIQEIEMKLRKGQELDPEEDKFLETVQKREADYQKKMQERMLRYYH